MWRPVLIPCLVLFGLAALARSGAAQTPAKPDRIGVSAAVGLFVPRDATMSAVYGSVLAPITAHVDVAISRRFAVFGGLRWLPASGATIPAGESVTDDRFATSLGVRTFRAGVLAHARLAARWSLAVGGGAGLTSYNESIPDVALETSGRTTGVFALAEARFAVRPRWSVIGRFEYSRMPADTGGESIDIGGPDVQVGVRFAF